MVAEYFIELFQIDRDSWSAELEDCVRDELNALGVHRSVHVTVASAPVERGPAVGVYFGSVKAASDSDLTQQLTTALEYGKLIVPVVDSLANFSSVVPPILRPINGLEWTGSSPGLRVARKLLEELGIEDRRRRVFISHKREDGLAAAEQLHDFLAHHGFEPFVDRFAIRSGSDVQKEIADALEHHAFLLLVETPLAHESEWVFDEVEYAQSHLMGMHIVTWPGKVAEVPATHGLPRQRLQPTDLKQEKGYEVFEDKTLDAILAEVEAIHANTIARRRRYLLGSVEDAARVARLDATPLEGWRLLVGTNEGPTVVQVSARLPTVEDLYALDGARSVHGTGAAAGVLVHAARLLPADRQQMLSWAAGARALTLIPENAVGGYWRE